MASMANDCIWHPYTRFSAFRGGPLPEIVRGEGVYLYDRDGRRYLDAISSWWACALGHGHPRMVEAIRRQAGVLQHSILGNLSHPPALELARELAALMPDPARHTHFASDGASAVEVALKIALQYAWNRGEPRRQQLVSLEQAYHGDTLGAVAVGFQESFHRPFKPVLFPTLRVPVPTAPDAEAAALDVARRLFAEHGSEVAALIVEPLCQGTAGMRMYSADFLRALFELAHEAGALFIADEIAMGFGRTGRWFAFEHAGIDPDIVCVGKALSAGYLPISGAIVRDAVYEAFSDEGASDHTLYHGHTWAGNPLAAAAAVEAIRIYREEGLIERAAALGARMAERLRPLASLEAVREVRTLGLIGAVELREEAASARGGRPPHAQRARAALLRRGLLARPLGPVLYLMPPLITPEAVLDDMVDQLAEAVKEST